MADGDGANTSKKFKNWFAMTDWASGKVSETDQKKYLAQSIDSLVKYIDHVRLKKASDEYSKSSAKLPFINPQTGQLHQYIPDFGERSEIGENDEHFFNTDAVRFLAWLDSISNSGSPYKDESDVEGLIKDVFPEKSSGDVLKESGFYANVGKILYLLAQVQANVAMLIASETVGEIETKGKDGTGASGAVETKREMTTAGVPLGGGQAVKPGEGGGEPGSPGEPGAQPPPTTQPQPTPVSMPGVVTEAERARRKTYAYESAWLKNTILQDLCRQHGITPSSELLDSLHEVVADSIGNMSQEQLRGLFANTSGRLQQLREIQTKLSGNARFIGELNKLYDAHYAALSRVDENQATKFKQATNYEPTQHVINESKINFASDPELQHQLENPVDITVNQTINQLTGHDPLSNEQLQSLELVLTQLATGLGDKSLAAELGLPINPNKLDIKDYIQSLDDLAIYRLIYGTKAKPDKAVLLKLRANLDQVKQNITNTCQTIIAEKSIEFHADGFAKGASSHVSEVSRTGDLHESPLGDVANRLMPVMSGSLFAPEAVALVQSQDRLSESSKAQQQFVKQFATTFHALDDLTQKMLIEKAGVDPATVIGPDGKYVFNEQFMRVAGKLSKILRDANKAREIKNEVDERLKQTHDLSLNQIKELERLSGELKRLGLHAEADRLQNDLKQSFKAQLDHKQRLVFEYIEQLTVAERALQEAEFQVRMARTHANTYQALIQANQPATDTVSAYLTARSAAFAAGAAADQALKKIVDLPPDQKEIANELTAKRMRVEKQLSDLKSELGGIKTARDLSQNLSNEDYKKVFQEFANPYYTDSQGNQREIWLPVSDEGFDTGQFEESSPIELLGEAGSYDVQPAAFGWGMPASDFSLDYNDFVGGDEYAEGGGDLVDQYNQTIESAKRGGGKSNTRRLAGHIQKKVQAKRAAKKVAEQAAKKAVEGAAEAGSTVAGAASGPAGWVVKGALMAAKVANMLRTKEGRKKLGMYAASATGAGISFYLALKGAMGAAAGGLAGAAAGGATGAIIGSFFGPLGTLIGAGIGGSLGAMGGYANGGGSIFGLGGGKAAVSGMSPAAYYPATPTATPLAPDVAGMPSAVGEAAGLPSAPTYSPATTPAGLEAGMGQSTSSGLASSSGGLPGAETGFGQTATTGSMPGAGVKTLNSLTPQPPTPPYTSQLSGLPNSRWTESGGNYTFDPNTGQVYDSAGKLVNPTGSTITSGTTGATAAGATAGAVGIAAVIGPLGLSGAAFFMPAISVLSVMFITLITIITIFAAFLTPMPVGTGFRSDPGATANRYLELRKKVTPSSVPNEAVESPNEVTVQYEVTITPKSGYQIRLTQDPKDEMYSLPDPPKSQAIKADWRPKWSALQPFLSQSSFPDPITQPAVATYPITFFKGKDALVMNEITIYYDVLSPDGEVVASDQEWTAFASFMIGDPDVLCWPTTGQITWLPNNIDPSNHPTYKENAYDIGGTEGAGVYSPFTGMAIGKSDYSGSNYGNYVAVSFGFGPHTGELYFAHLKEIDPLIGTNKRVPISTGQKLGTMGTTGVTSTGVHLHYELKKNNNFNNNFSLLIPPRPSGGNYRIGDQVRTCYPLTHTP